MGRTKRDCESRKLDRIDNNTEHEFPEDFNPSRSTDWYELDGGLYLHEDEESWVRVTYWSSGYNDTRWLEVHNAGRSIEVDGSTTLTEEFTMPEWLTDEGYTLDEVEILRGALLTHAERGVDTVLRDRRLSDESPSRNPTGRHNYVLLNNGVYRFSVNSSHFDVSFVDEFGGIGASLPDHLDLNGDLLREYVREELLADKGDHFWYVAYDLTGEPQFNPGDVQ